MTAHVMVSAVGLAPRATGIERYATALLGALLAAPAPGVELTPVVRAWLAAEAGLGRSDCVIVPDRLPAPAAIELALPAAVRRVRPDLLHGLDLAVPRAFTSPRGAGRPGGGPRGAGRRGAGGFGAGRQGAGRGPALVQMVHDAVPLDPGSTVLSRGARHYYGHSLRAAVRSARVAALVTTTQAAAEAIRPHTRPGLPVVPVGAAGFPLAGPVASPVGAPGSSPVASPVGAPTSGPVASPVGASGRGDVDVVVLSVGTVEPRKGLDVLAAAVAELRARGVRVRWWHVGRLGWGDVPAGCAHLGAVTDAELRGALLAADVFVSTSLDEGFNMAAAEAVGAGLPCVLSDIPAHRELYRHAATLVPVGDVGGVAAAVLAAATAGAAPAADAGRSRELSSWASVADRVVGLWRTVLADASHSAPASTDHRAPALTDDRPPTLTDDRAPTLTDDRAPALTDDRLAASTDHRAPAPTDLMTVQGRPVR